MLKDLVVKNRSYRRYRESATIARSTLEELVDLGRLAASGTNHQPLKYWLSCDRETNATIFSCLGWAANLPEWPGPSEGERPSAYIVILGDTTIRKSFGVDHGIAAQNILLGATEKGLCGCMLGNIRRPKLREALGIPDQYEILLVVSLGEPGEEIVLEGMPPDGDHRYYRDEPGRHHVPKRSLAEIILN